MPARLRPADPDAVRAAIAAVDAGAADRSQLRLLVKHYLARLSERAPGRAVEVRVPPYSAVQVIGGTTHTRGTPPAVVETDAETWLSVARGLETWHEVVAQGRVRASGERSDLTAYLPLPA